MLLLEIWTYGNMEKGQYYHQKSMYIFSLFHILNIYKIPVSYAKYLRLLHMTNANMWDVLYYIYIFRLISEVKSNYDF